METPAESLVIVKPRRPWWRRWLKRIGWSLLVLLLLAAGVHVWLHYSFQKRLDETLAEMDRADPGWRLEDIEAAREQIPEAENSARVVVAAGKLLPHPWPPKELNDRSFDLPPPELLAADDFARLTKELDAVAPALKEARKLVNLPKGRHRIAYKSDMNTSLEDQTLTRYVLMLVVCDAHRHAQRGDAKAALTSCRAALNAGRSLGDEPLAISQIIRTACISISCRAIERVLAQGEPSPDEMAAVQKLLEDEDAFPDLFHTARGERAVTHDTYNALENGRIHLVSLGESDGPPNWLERLKGPLYGEVVLHEHPTMLALMNRWVALTQLPSHEQADAEEQLRQDPPKTAILTRLIFPSATKIGMASRCKHAQVRCIVVALVAERYRQRHKKWPDSLDQLCPRFLATVPLDPFDGEALRYRRLDDGVVIYSVGLDGSDDGGHLDPKHVTQPGVDVGVRLWDVAKRHQPPAPKRPEDDPPR